MLKCLSILCVFASLAFGEVKMVKREQPASYKTSVIIPCVPLHIDPLKELIMAYCSQSVLPDEIVVAFSETGRVDESEWDWFDEQDWPFRVNIVRSSEKCSPGKNRNIGVENATGEIILCNDADDIPHPQRIEIVKYLFETYELEHLLHGWISRAEEFKTFESMADLDAAYQYKPEEFEIRYHNANVCLLKEVWGEVKWKESFEIDLDKTFNQTIYNQNLCEHRGVVFSDLIQWRTDLSTYNRGTTY